ncbi:MAG: uroporphyrinogen-III C-methyltransferase [Burkholderiales bacterium]
MSDPLEQAPTTQTDIAPHAVTKRGVSWPGLVALAALAISLWQWWDNRQQYSNLQQELARRLSEADGAMKQNAVTVQQANDTAKGAQINLAALEGKFADSQNQQVALEAMYQELSKSRDEWSLTEIEQILSIAGQQLQLAGNVPGALAALQAADHRLQRIDKPQLTSLRKVIDQDIQKLKALPFVDIVGLSVKLDNLISGIDAMPLISDARPSQNDTPPAQEPTGNTWNHWTSGMWNEIRQLVRIQHMDQPEAPLLSPSQSYFLRENLRLRLLSARLALLSHDETTFKADLRAARDWLNHYFDTANRNVRNDDAVLRQLIDSSISIQLPDVSGSLDAVRNYKLTARETSTQ